MSMEDTQPRRRMVLYRRISDDREGQQNGVDRQDRQCRQLAAKNGDDIVAVFTDNDMSAWSGKPRKDYARMVEFLEAGRADGILALAPTRIYRRLYEPNTGQDALSFLALVERRRLAVETVKQGRYDLSTADGRRDALRAAIDAQYESEQISERVRDAKADSVAAGAYRGGPRPFGYEADGTTPRTLVCPECGAPEGFDVDRVCLACGAHALNAPDSEAWYTEQATRSVVAGASLASIERDWAAAKVRTVPRRYRQADGSKGEPEDRPWKREEIRKLLLRPRNAGLMEVTKIGPDKKKCSEIVGRAAWAPIVDEETWRACHAILTNPARRTTTGNARVFLGTGIYGCFCGSTMRGSTTGIGGTTKALKLASKAQTAGAAANAKPKTHKPAYRCQANPNHNIRDAGDLDAFIEAQAVARLARPDAAALHLKLVQQNPEEDLAGQAVNLRAKLDSISADYNQDLITRAQMLDMTAGTRERLNAVTAKMASRAATSVLASLPLGSPEIEAAWEGYHLERRRQIIHALMTITVNKARRGRPPGYKPPANGERGSYFDPTTIDIQWKPAV